MIVFFYKIVHQDACINEISVYICKIYVRACCLVLFDYSWLYWLS